MISANQDASGAEGRWWWDAQKGNFIKGTHKDPVAILTDDDLNDREQHIIALHRLLAAWCEPVNWEDGSAEVEGRIIEGQQRLLTEARALLNRTAELGIEAGS